MNTAEICNILEDKGLRVIRELGHGKYAICFLVQSPYRVQFCCKVQYIEDGQQGALDIERYKREVKALSTICSPFVVKLYDYFTFKKYLVMVLEFCNNGTLISYVNRFGVPSGDTLRRMISHIVYGLQAIHELNIAHLDIKPGNILVDTTNEVKIADFGLCYIADKVRETKYNKYAGSFPYIAPEIMMKKLYDPFKGDIWSLGITIYYLATGTLPVSTKNEKELFNDLKFGISDLIDELPEDIAMLVHMCLKYDPDERATIKEISDYVYNNFPRQSIVRKRTITLCSNLQKTSMKLSTRRFKIIKPKSHLHSRTPVPTMLA